METLGLFVLLYLVLMIPISFYASRYVKTTNDFVLAGRNLPFYMALATVFATWLGSDSILGASSYMAQGGFLEVIADPFGAGLCLIIIGLFFARKLYSLNHLTIGDYFEQRYNKTIGTILSLAITLTYFGWVGAQFVALGLVMHWVFGLPLIAGIIISATIVVMYTYIGGMWSVVMHDLVQTAIIIVGLVVILIQVSINMGGFSNIINATPPEFFNLTPENTSSAWLAYIAAWMAIGLGSIPQQDVYQRVMSARSAKIAQWAAIGGGLLYFTVVMIPLFLGLAAAQLHPELLQEGADAQMLLPTLIGEHTSLIVQIFFFGALLSAIMSTASAALLAPATLIAENVVKPFFPQITDGYRMQIIQTSIIIVAIGAITLAIQQGDVYELVGSAYSITLVAALVPLTFGLYWKKANNLGAMLAIIFGIVTWQYLGHTLPEEYVDASTIAGFGMSIVGMLVGVAMTHVRGGEKKDVPFPARVG